MESSVCLLGISQMQYQEQVAVIMIQGSASTLRSSEPQQS